MIGTMLRPFIRTALTLFALTFIFPTVQFSSWVTLLVASVVLTILMGLGKPILKLLTLPINVVTLGLFSSIITIFLLWLTTYLVPGFQIAPMVLFGVNLGPLLSLAVVSFVIGFLQSIVKIFV